MRKKSEGANIRKTLHVRWINKFFKLICSEPSYQNFYIDILAWDLCIYMHRESESDVKVDPIVKWIWSKV